MTFPINGGGFFNPILSRPPLTGQASFPIQTNGVANLVLTPQNLISDLTQKLVMTLVETARIAAQIAETNIVEGVITETGIMVARLDESGIVSAELVETGVVKATLKDC